MSGAGLAALRRLISDRYEAIKHQVARRLGGASDMAGDALHDAYMRLSVRDDLDAVRHPQSYLVNTAVHVAIDRIRQDVRLLSESEVSEFFDVADTSPGPEAVTQSRSDLAQMFDALDGLTPRQRDILLAARVEGLSRPDLAKRWGISVRLVGRELQTAHEHCVRAMARTES
ncbi:sigma-70 family RNA polymerase sigma factor [Achromobacter seleniivolatilans]|uniref:Sigma-70 family RNA polymerase sigma factor n=1 Tax=Achromobacter seleniivolatilans TaxID=3047478 RepID=A0ABY9LWS6_9BURK|nr:sigma-70 family RNA polymerase sigma factor [Achromobacter sp. R39]WMD18152.1 sigma-70 family RNA polymerase sigma factor [Achromobacter sp. R39]